MDQQEAAEVERRLREILRENGLEWVLEQVDEAIRGGKFGQREATTLKEYYEEAELYLSLDGRFATKGRAKLTAIEDYSARERIRLLIDATEQAAVVSTYMASEASQRLGELRNGNGPARIKFVADDDAEELPTDLTEVDERSQDADRLRELLDALRDMVDDQ